MCSSQIASSKWPLDANVSGDARDAEAAAKLGLAVVICVAKPDRRLDGETGGRADRAGNRAAEHRSGHLAADDSGADRYAEPPAAVGILSADGRVGGEDFERSSRLVDDLRVPRRLAGNAHPSHGHMGAVDRGAGLDSDRENFDIDARSRVV